MLRSMNKDFLSGLVLLVVAGLYASATNQIADSTLSDEVGAGGLPRLLTYALAGLGAVLIVRSLAAVRRPAVAPAEGDPPEDARLPRALGLLALGAGYVLVLPYVGYIAAVALLIAAVAIYERAKWRWTLPAIAISGAVLYWAVFVKLLGVNQPVGSLWQALLR